MTQAGEIEVLKAYNSGHRYQIVVVVIFRKGYLSSCPNPDKET
jgi:hypothetical protein